MNIEENDINHKTEAQAPNEEAVRSSDDQSRMKEIEALQEDIIRNDTIPETQRNTPGSNGAFPVGAFDTSKD